MRSSLKLGYFTLTLAQVGISVNVVVSKYLVETMPMFFLLATRFCISTVVLGALLKLSHTALAEPTHPEGKLTSNDWLLGILQGIFAAFLFNLFFVWGLQYTTATAAGIVGSTLPAIIAISAVWLLKETLNLSTIMALILAMLGILVINFDHFEGAGNPNHSYFGDLLVFLAMFPEAWYSILGRKLAGRMTPLGAAFISNLVGFITLLPCALFTGAFELNVYSLGEWGLLLVAATSSLIFFWAWGWGLSFIPASTAAVFGGIMPVTITLLAMIFLGESLRWYDTAGILFVFVSIIVGAGWRPPFLRKAVRAS